MSDYTPSPAEVRAHRTGGARMRRGAEFDRMIAKVRAEEREKADREPSDAEVEAAKAVLDSVEYADEPQAIRAALIAAQEVRRGD